MIINDQKHEEYVCIHSYAVAKIYTPVSELNKRISETSIESILYKGRNGKNRHYKIDDIHDSFKRVSRNSFTEDYFTLKEYIRYKGNDQPIEKRRR